MKHRLYKVMAFLAIVTIVGAAMLAALATPTTTRAATAAPVLNGTPGPKPTIEPSKTKPPFVPPCQPWPECKGTPPPSKTPPPPTETKTPPPPTETKTPPPPTETKTPPPPPPPSETPPPVPTVSAIKEIDEGNVKTPSCKASEGVTFNSPREDGNGIDLVHYFGVSRTSLTLSGKVNTTDMLPVATNGAHDTEPTTGCEEVWARLLPGDTIGSQLWLHSVDGSNPRVVKHNGQIVYGEYPQWGQDGFIYFVDNAGVNWRVSPDGKNLEELKGIVGHSLVLSPDGKFLASLNEMDMCITDLASMKQVCQSLAGMPTKWNASGDVLYTVSSGLNAVSVEGGKLITSPLTRYVRDYEDDPTGQMYALRQESAPEQAWFVSETEASPALNFYSFEAYPSAKIFAGFPINEWEYNPDWFVPATRRPYTDTSSWAALFATK